MTIRRRLIPVAALFGMAMAVLLLVTPARAGDERIPFPAELQPDVDFWIRVYSEVTTSEGFLHDDRDLSIVYRKLRFERDVTPAARRKAVDAEREKIQRMLRRLASGTKSLTEEEREIAEAFGTRGTKARYEQAASSVRFQLGQADRFRAGVERSGIWESHIADTFAKLGLPPELSALPHVESSFDPTAYSKVGAAGMWQFMPATGRRFLRINDAIDERMDPFRAAEAAAQLLEDNYRILGSWPLALTAYNHGTGGMRRARDTMGTTDIAIINRQYRGPSFGFASRNFYPSFLAALTIDRDPEKYFGKIARNQPMQFTEIELPSYVPVTALEKTLQVDRGTLRDLNPALMGPVWSGNQHVPKGYRLRLPQELNYWNATLLTQQLGGTQLFGEQPRARTHKVVSGESLSTVARRHGISVQELASLNGLASNAHLRVDQTLRLPGAAEPAAPAAPPPQQVTQVLAEQRAEAAAVAVPVVATEPVTVAEVRASPSLVPGGAVARAAESVDFSVSSDNTIRVAAEETLGHFAQWLGVSASALRSLNGMSANASVPLGRRLKLDFSKTTPEQFVSRRREFHDSLHATFFAGHRIVGTQVYVVRQGDSLWNVAQRNGSLPAWLVLHYNPHVDFSALRAGVEIVIPKIEVLSAV